MTILYNTLPYRKIRKQLRSNMPEAEKILWSRLKNKQLGGFKFRRQYGIGSYVVDFYCVKLKLAIEIDGDSHYTKKAIKYDKLREEALKCLGIKFLRFTNTDIYTNLEEVLEKVNHFLTSP
jgi:very-short-patch-repair endonuclease